MKLVNITAGADGESHVQQCALEYSERGGLATATQAAVSVSFVSRRDGAFTDFHPAPRRQYMLYLTARVQLGLGDGSSVIMEPGDVLLAEDTTGHGHTSSVLAGGLCAVVPLG